jgi:NAD+ kinase
MAEFGLLVHPDRKRAHELAAGLVDWLIERGHGVRLPEADAMLVGRPQLGERREDVAAGLDLLIGVGGDGTILHSVDLAADDRVPVLGINAGQLGYLTAVEPDGAKAALKRFLAGSYDVEERMRLESSVDRADGSSEFLGAALNEVVVERANLGHTVRLQLTLDGESFTSYLADGMICATPTGSTAYAFSVRGPIVAPQHRAILVAPVSPHMLFDRCLVLEPGSVVELTVLGERHARVSVDGRDGGELVEGDTIRCTAADRSARLVTFGGRDFHRVLREKFGLSAR